MTLRARIVSDINDVFMNTDHFADDFVNARTGLTISVLFDKEFVTIIEDVESLTPAIACADSDILGVLHGDVYTEVSTSTAYNVIGIQPDGTGLTLLLLSQD